MGCSACFKRYPSLSALKNHFRPTHRKKEKYICESCGYETLILKGYVEHKFTVHGESPADGRLVKTCSENGCGYQTTIKFRLSVHMMKKHNAERKFKCKVCGKGFLCQTHLREHEEIHKGTKPYQCEICGNSVRV